MNVNFEKEATEFNADLEQLLILFNIKKECIKDFDAWDLEKCYYDIRALYRELDSLIDDGERTNARVLLKEIDDIRKEQLNNDDNETKSRYFTKLEELYLLLCLYIKQYKLAYRQKSSPAYAILNR